MSFFNSLKKNNFTFLSHKSNSFIVKEKEIFIFQTKEFMELESNLYIYYDDIDDYSKIVKNCIIIKPYKNENKYEVEVYFIEKGEYKLIFNFSNRELNKIIRLDYYPICQQDSKLAKNNQFLIILRKYF